MANPFILWKSASSHSRTVLRWLVLWLVIAVLSGCQRHDVEDVFDDYRYRLSNVFEVEFDALNIKSNRFREGLEYPSQRDLKIQVTTSSVSILDFLRLSECELQRLLGQRNSSLGKLAHDSQRLLYHLQFIQLAEECIAQLHGRENRAELLAVLKGELRNKKQNTPTMVWNALFASEEFQTLLSNRNGVLTNEVLSQSPVVLLQAIEQLKLLVNAALDQQAISSEALESALQVIGSENYMGRLLLSIRYTRMSLDQINEKLSQGFDREKFCPDGRLLERGRVMKTVFESIYLKKVQPLLADTVRKDILLFELIKLQEQVATLSGNDNDHWLLSPSTSELLSLKGAIKKHVEEWQSVLGACGLRPMA